MFTTESYSKGCTEITSPMTNVFYSTSSLSDVKDNSTTNENLVTDALLLEIITCLYTIAACSDNSKLQEILLECF